MLRLATISCLFVLASSLLASSVRAQEITTVPSPPAVRVMKRVDTSNAEVQLVLKAWVDSLAVWRQSALGLGTARDRSGLAGMPDGVVRNWFGQSAEVVATFPPTVLSIEPIEQGWEIRTLFSATDLLSRHIVPLGILRSAFVRDDKGTWTVESPLLRTTSDWEETRTDRIRYVHPANLKVNKSRAKAASDFVASTAATFGIEPPTRITFYVTNSRDAMSTLLGIEYYSYPPSGLSYPAENIILSGMGDAWYPHELVHIVFRDFDDAHPVVREGVATWLGGSLGEDFSVLLTRYIREKKPTEIPSFVQLFTDPYLPQDDVYIVGAALCKAMYNKAGAKAILELLRSKSTSDAMISITRVLGIEPGDRQETLVPLLTQLLEQSAVDAGR